MLARFFEFPRKPFLAGFPVRGFFLVCFAFPAPLFAFAFLAALFAFLATLGLRPGLAVGNGAGRGNAVRGGFF